MTRPRGAPGLIRLDARSGCTQSPRQEPQGDYGQEGAVNDCLQPSRASAMSALHEGNTSTCRISAVLVEGSIQGGRHG